MYRDVIEVTMVEVFRLRLRFEDGAEGEVDCADLLSFKGVFAPLKDPKEFAKVSVNSELGTICWPNGADLCPDVLYSRVTGAPLPGHH
ncbi:MAG: DUF2442 domain-containing protein [Magnetospirillum sp.]|nr:DUF2442 domain-containing protein [Magnetospirillum sp.]